ncbi:MAG: hypothetical protein SCH39_12440 [Methanosarcinales archaeon]|nr:hypothetical protein [ANME-2 cluster archaeon]MDF1530787.1 hypothetical protein [ANME-2 cluster archaeon]MDW7777124.1 hypothetical protein [Methanosarcinales archaeon]
MKNKDKKNVYIGDEFTEEDELEGKPEVNELEGLYDLMIPPGVPESLIVELVEEFDLEPVTRLANVQIVEIDPREILVLRGDLETVNMAHDYMVKRMREISTGGFKSPWVKD